MAAARGKHVSGARLDGAAVAEARADIASAAPADAAALLADLRRRATNLARVWLGPSGTAARSSRPRQPRAPCSRTAAPTTISVNKVGPAVPPGQAPKLMPASLAGPLTATLEALLGAGRLESLHLGIPLSGRRLERFAAALAANRSLQELSLAGSGCGDDVAVALRGALVGHTNIHTLDLSCCNLTDAGAAALAGLLAAQRAKRAELAWMMGLRHQGPPARHPAAPEGAAAGGSAGQEAPPPTGGGAYCLQRLLLSGNPAITDAGAEALAGALVDDGEASACGGGGGSRGLRHLELRGCGGVTAKGVRAFLRALAELPAGCAAATFVDLRDCGSPGPIPATAARASAAADDTGGMSGVLLGPLVPVAARRPPRRARAADGAARPPVPAAEKPARPAGRCAASEAKRDTAPGGTDKKRAAGVQQQAKGGRAAVVKPETAAGRKAAGRLPIVSRSGQAEKRYPDASLSTLQQVFCDTEALVAQLEDRIRHLLPP